MSKKLTTVCLALAAMFAFGAISAGAAQAVEPSWTTATENPIAKNYKIKKTVTLTPRETGETPASTELTVPASNLKLHGTGVEIEEGVIEPTKTGKAKSITFTGVTETGAEKTCLVHSVGAPAGTVKTEEVKAELATIPAGGTTYALFTPPTGLFTKIIIEKAEGRTCASSGTFEVTGTAALKVLTGTMEAKVEATGTQKIQEESGKKLFFGANPAYLDVTGDLELEGGVAWGVNP